MVEMGIQKNNFEYFMKVGGKGRTEVTRMRVQIGAGQPHPQAEVERREVEWGAKKLKTG